MIFYSIQEVAQQEWEKKSINKIEYQFMRKSGLLSATRFLIYQLVKLAFFESGYTENTLRCA